MPSRRHICDVPGCGATRQRWQRLCDACFRKLPGDIRTGIKEHHRAHRRKEHAADCRRARAHIDARAAAGVERARQAFERTEHLLGEH